MRGLLRDLRAARALRRCRELIVGNVYTPTGFQIWLTASNRNLSRHRPIDLILWDCGQLAVAEAERLASS